jgi:N-acetylglucosamine kinase-like BadF-type ATPase
MGRAVDIMNFLLGVDGGNTKTLALVAGDNGVILGTGRAGCGDIYGATSQEAAIAEIEHAVVAAITEAGIQTGQRISSCSKMRCGSAVMVRPLWSSMMR